MRAYSAAAVAVGSGFESNPSPGNIKDGLITDAINRQEQKKAELLQLLMFWITQSKSKTGIEFMGTPGNV